jgi:hypothetical protein
MFKFSKSDGKTVLLGSLGVVLGGLMIYYLRSAPVVGQLFSNARRGFDA